MSDEALVHRSMIKNIFAFFLVCLAFWCQAEIIHGKVVAVLDGDTITVLDAEHVQHKIRLAGIDAPEKSQPYGQRSKQSLSDLVFSRQVDVHSEKRDRYGREIGKVMLGDDDVNLEQVRRGMAWFYRQYQQELSTEDRERYGAAEQQAQTAKVGLWGGSLPQPPWEYRRLKK